MSPLKFYLKKILRKTCINKMRILRLCHRKNDPSIPENHDKQSVLIPPLKRNFPVTLRLLQKKETTIRIIHSTLRK
jgi:hypothetical protein